jgi:hypothetical protein
MPQGTMQLAPRTLAERGLMECRTRDAGSARLDVGRPDDLAPLLDFVGEKLAEFGRCIGIGTPPRSVMRSTSAMTRLSIRSGSSAASRPYNGKAQKDEHAEGLTLRAAATSPEKGPGNWTIDGRSS